MTTAQSIAASVRATMAHPTVLGVPAHKVQREWHQPGDPWFGTAHYSPLCPGCNEPHYFLGIAEPKRGEVVECSRPRCRMQATFVAYAEPLRPRRLAVRK